MKDALGNDIVIGKSYGYSVRNSGAVEVIVGEVSEIQDDGVKIVNIKRGRGFGNQEITPVNPKRSIGKVIPNSLFPVEHIKWS
jgi:hypothetical protein